MRYFYMWYEIFLYVLSIPLSSHVWTRVFFISILGLVFFLPYTTFIECFLDQLCALIYAFVRASLASLPKCFISFELSLFITYRGKLRSLFVDCRLQRVMVTMATAYPSLTFTSLTLTCTPSCLGNQTSTWPQCSPVHGPCRPHDWLSIQQVSLIIQLSSLYIQFNTKEG